MMDNGYGNPSMKQQGQNVNGGTTFNQQHQTVGNQYNAGRDITISYQILLRPVPLQFSAGVQRMVEDYTAIFGGRDAELARLDTFLTADQRAFGLLIAPTGRGKTALLIHWIARVQQQYPDWRVVFAPISIRYQTASEQVALSLLAHTLAEVHNDIEQFHKQEHTPANLRALVGDYLRRPLPDDVRLLVVLDGLDEATGWQVSRELFPSTPQAQLKIVVAARAMAHRPRALWYRDLGFARRQTCDLELEGLSRAAVRDLLQRMGNPLDALATDVDVLAEIERVSAGDPVVIRLLVELLRDGEIQPGQLAHLPADDLNAVFDLWLEHLRASEREHERVYALLQLVATAYGPLTTADVQALNPTHLPAPRDGEDAARALARFVIGDGTPAQGYVFSHQKLREVYCEQRLGNDQQAIRQRFVAYGMRWYAERSTPLPAYLRQHWVAHLRDAGAWTTLRRVLTEIVPAGAGERYLQPWADARSRAEGSNTGYLSDLAVLWQWADQQQDVVLAVRCALIAASLRSLSGNLSPDLLVALVTVGTPDGTWSAAAALEHIRQMPDSGRQADCIKALCDAQLELPWAIALDVARAIADDPWGSRARALTALAPLLPPEQQPAVWQDALAAARAIAEEWHRAEALSALAPHLSPELLPTALAATRAIEDDWSRARALTALAPHLPPVLQPAVWQEALAAAHAIEYEGSRARALAALAPPTYGVGSIGDVAEVAVRMPEGGVALLQFLLPRCERGGEARVAQRPAVCNLAAGARD